MDHEDPIAAGLEAGAECLEAALDYLRRGWSVLALCPPDHIGVARVGHGDCGSPGKRPWHTWAEYQGRLPTEAEVREWWRVMPNSNVGVALGPVSGLIRVDVEGEAGEAALQAKSHGDLPPTLEFRSGRADGTGRGLLYSIPPGVTLRTTAESHGAKQELRFQAQGAQTALPPSRHQGGGRYAWLVGRGPGDLEPAPAPAWLVSELAERRHAPRGPAESGAIAEGSRNTRLTSLAGSMRHRGFGEPAIAAALLEENARRCDPPLAEAEVRTIARHVAAYPPDALAGVTLRGVGANGNGHANGHAGTAEARPLVRRLADVPREPVEWLWTYWIPCGSLTILDGDPGLGKSTMALDLAARVSAGLAMPPATGLAADRAPAGVLLLTAEDSLSQTVGPRLDACGADDSRVHAFCAVWEGDGDERPPELPWDLPLIEGLVVERGVKLVIVDPLMAYLAGEFDAHKDQQIRRCLHRLSILAERRRLALLVLRHLNKLNGGPALYRGGGSIGIVGAARSALVAGTDPEDRDRHVLAMNKPSLGPFPESLAYRIVPAGAVSRVEWLGPCDLTRDDILAHPPAARLREADKAAAFVREFLAGGPRPAAELTEAGAAEGFTERTLMRARQTLKVKAKKDRFDGGWTLSLPGETGNGVPAPDATVEAPDPFD